MSQSNIHLSVPSEDEISFGLDMPIPRDNATQLDHQATALMLIFRLTYTKSLFIEQNSFS